MSFRYLLGLGFMLCLASGCASSMRLPASLPKYNGKMVDSLKSAAINGVLFQVGDSVFRDVEARQVEQCRKASAPSWSQQMTKFLDMMDKNPQYYNKIHMVDFRRGDQAKAEVSKDIDGLSYLTISYGKRETHEKITASTVMPCNETASEAAGKELIETKIDWPSEEDIATVLKAAPPKIAVTRWQFNTEFLVFLAEHQAFLKLSPEVSFERNYEGDYFLVTWLDKMAHDVGEKTTELDHLNYWLKEISTRSHQAQNIQFFGLHSEPAIVYGVQVDTIGKFARKINNYQEPTYVFMSYHQENGQYVYNDLKSLNECLKQLTGIYRNPLNMNTSLEGDADSFLSPGFSCKLDGKEN